MAMALTSEVRWAPKVRQDWIGRLYQSDADGLLDSELLEKVGMALFARCESILEVTEAHIHGRIKCPRCGMVILRKGWYEILECGCGFTMPWVDYHRTYKGKQLFGANAVPLFQQFVEKYPSIKEDHERMMCIDRLIHGFHSILMMAKAQGIELPADADCKEGRPVAANLIEGNLRDVVRFLDHLSTSPSWYQWRARLKALSWSGPFIEDDSDSENSTGCSDES
jgi:DNA-directed RNA polymerase subunit RPC12/RpoP